MPAMQDAVLQMTGISKSFPGVRALSGVDFTVRAGEVHALMGENGAGKSTLVKVLTGVYPRDGGEVRFDGRPINPRSPQDAEACGISTVYQEINLIPELSVAENICLGRQPRRWGLIDWRGVRARAERALARLELSIDVSQNLSSYPVAIQQMAAIARALDVDSKLLILDEPTSSLDEHEVEDLFRVVRSLRQQGMGVVFITHFLDQTYGISDRITILRDGRLVGTYETATLPRLEMVGKMIGKDPRQVAEMEKRQGVRRQGGKRFLEAENLGRAGSIAPVSFAIAEGEVVGLAGLLGSGRTELARLVFGIDQPDSGALKLDGAPARVDSPQRAIRHGFAFTSEDRKVSGIVPDLSIRENIVLALQGRRGVVRVLSKKEQYEIASRLIEALGVKTPGPDQAIKNLSGGNQQKALLARWLALQPRLLILDEPTRGIDVGAKAEIEKLMRELCDKGMAILFISSELEEVARDSDRIVVLRDRKKVGELAGEDIDLHAVMKLIAD
jgi:simple sugar transport system ATP-binding protein